MVRLPIVIVAVLGMAVLGTAAAGAGAPVGTRAAGTTDAATYLVALEGPSWSRVELVGRGRVIEVLATGYAGDVGAPTQSADGALIAWLDGNVLAVARADGTATRTKVSNVMSYAWAPRGHRLLVVSLDDGRRVKVIDLVTGRGRDVTPPVPDYGYGNDTGLSVGAWYPSGLIEYAGDDPTDPHCSALTFAPVTGGMPRIYSTTCPSYHVPEPEFSVSPDGRRLLAVTKDQGGIRASSRTVVSGRQSRLALPPGAQSAVWLTADLLGLTVLQGDRMAVMTFGVADRRGRTLMVLGRSASASGFIVSPDGRRLALTISGEALTRIVSMRFGGGGLLRTLASTDDRRDRVASVCWRPDGTVLLVRDGSRLYETRDRPGAGTRLVFTFPPTASLSLAGCGRS